jgi:hypothetical protein
MKSLIILFASFFFLMIARADLVLKEQIIQKTQMETNISTDIIKVHGNKIRDDIFFPTSATNASASYIYDRVSFERILLDHKEKTYARWSEPDSTGRTNEVDVIAPKIIKTDRTEKIRGYDTEIYTCSETNGVNWTYWIAKDFPNYERMKKNLVYLEKPRDGFPDVSELPGMLIKYQRILRKNNLAETHLILSAKEEPVELSIFEIPKDYKDDTQPKSK